MAAADAAKSSPGRARTARPSKASSTSRRTSRPASAIRCSSSFTAARRASRGPVPFGSTSTYPIDIWLNKGALVLEPNYRGSAGYGETFRSLNVRNLGVGDAWDVISGIDHLVAQGLADNDKVGTMGWSQGGYISAFLTTHDSARFKAVSVGAGISNWMTYYVNTDIHPFTRQYLKATPWDDPKIYADTSPMTYIKQAKAPTLIQHGELDQRVPIPNAYELYQGLQDQGVPAKLIVYKGFGHGLTKPKAHRAAMEHNLEWFGKYIWGETPPAPPKVAAKVEPFAGITNFAPIDDTFACAGAIKPEAAAELKRRGYASVVNFRKASEEGAAIEKEKEAVEAAGLKYIAIPWARTDARREAGARRVPRGREGPGEPADASSTARAPTARRRSGSSSASSWTAGPRRRRSQRPRRSGSPRIR